MSKLKSIREIEMERTVQPNFGKGISVASGFDLGAKAPLDSRLTVKTVEERDAHVTGNRAYEGMLVYVETDKKTYQLVNNTWEEFGFNEEKFEAGIKPVKDRIDVLEGLVIGDEGEGIEAILSDVAQAKSDIAELQTNVETKASKEEMQASINSINSEISGVKENITTVEGKVSANTENITRLSSDLQAEITRAKQEEVKIKNDLSASISEEVSNREAAVSAVNAKISEMDAAYKNADTAIKGRLDALEGATADLEQIRTDIDSNTAAIAKEVQDRTQAVSGVDAKITAEVSRATEAEQALGVRIDGVEEDLAEAITNAQADATAKSAQALKDAKNYTDSKVAEINAANVELEARVEANETALGLVDGKISTAKDEAVQSSKTYTDGQISTIDVAYKAADTQVLNDAKSHAELKVQETKEALETSIGVVDGKLTAAKSELQGNIDTLAGRVSTNESDIANLKDAVANKNSNTIVVETEAEIASANPTPKVGDLAYVISTKRAYIFKGVQAALLSEVPAGWVVFDEITNELDLVDYLKKDEAASTYRRLDTQIKESDLEGTLSTKINNKADKSYVDTELAKKTDEAYVNSRVEQVVSPVRTQAETNKAGLAQEITDRKGEITRVEGLVSSAKTELTESIGSVDAKVESVTASLTEKEEALKTEDAKLNTRINNFIPVIDSSEPIGTETGHVWLQLV